MEAGREAGRELDVLVAKNVMELSVSKEQPFSDCEEDFYILTDEKTYSPARPVPNYSTDIVAAMPVAEKAGIMLMPVRVFRDYEAWTRADKEHSEIWWLADSYEESAALGDSGAYFEIDQEWHGFDVLARTAPLAICLAALKEMEDAVQD